MVISGGVPVCAWLIAEFFPSDLCFFPNPVHGVCSDCASLERSNGWRGMNLSPQHCRGILRPLIPTAEIYCSYLCLLTLFHFFYPYDRFISIFGVDNCWSFRLASCGHHLSTVVGLPVLISGRFWEDSRYASSERRHKLIVCYLLMNSGTDSPFRLPVKYQVCPKSGLIILLVYLLLTSLSPRRYPPRLLTIVSILLLDSEKDPLAWLGKMD